ncbi:MAG TPA: NifB/NifX family molybdenum-iron cluster-binding protein, partial [bacterium]|nr:NifB/NifX family molybdenum-iron cluster-binding protein [bacterium]
MIVAVAVAADCGINTDMAARFGRASGFLLCDTETGRHSFLPNDQNLNAPQGAGIQAARHVVESGAEAVV